MLVKINVCGFSRGACPPDGRHRAQQLTRPPRCGCGGTVAQCQALRPPGTHPSQYPLRHPVTIRFVQFRPPSACHKPPNSEPDSEPAQNASETHTLLTLTCNMYYVLRTFSQPHEPFTLYASFTRLRVGRRVTSCDVLRSLRHQQQTKQRLARSTCQTLCAQTQ